MTTFSGWKNPGVVICTAVLSALCACQNVPPANLAPGNATLSFGNVLVGTTSSSQTVSWQNTGGDVAEIYQLKFDDNSQFAYGAATFQGAVVNPGASAPQAPNAWPIVFKPRAVGAQTGEVKPDAFNPSGANRPLRTPVSLQGNGVGLVSVGDLSVVAAARRPIQCWTSAASPSARPVHPSCSS
ncbi:MAG TPA: hypothetical protein VGA88_05530 [Burkholderiales bacterium]